MNGITPFEIIFANVIVNASYGILPAIAIIIVGVLILRRMPPRVDRRDSRETSSRGHSGEKPVEKSSAR